ncbi:transmembrane transport protein [Embleya sp. NPDC055664]
MNHDGHTDHHDRDDDRKSVPLPPDLRRVIARETSLRSRLRDLAVGLAGGCGAAFVALLWATEPHALPTRTRIAFAALIVVGLAWAAFGTWALTARRPLYGHDEVVGGRIALAATTATTVGGTALAAARGGPGAALATGLAGAALIALTAGLLYRAHTRRRTLLRRRHELREGTG